VSEGKGRRPYGHATQGSGAIDVNYATTNGTATAGSDYEHRAR
jgi:hypothetical protein